MNEAALGGFGSGPAATNLSNGLLLAVTCADQPQPFDLRAPLAVQERQLNAAYKSVVASSTRTFLPFTPQEALNGAGALCLGWPAPTNPPPRSRRETLPNVPTLVLEGSLDTVTPPPAARAVAHEFRHSRYVEVPLVGHVAALHDYSGCASSIAARFIASNTIDSACLARIPAPTQVEAFPTTFAQENPITPINANGAAGLSVDDLRTVAIARDVISDVLWRWGPLGRYSERGLRGGSFTTIEPAVRGEFRVHLDAIRWTTDTLVTGDLETSRANTMNGAIAISTPSASAEFSILASHLGETSAHERLIGTLNGHAIDLTVAAKLVR
jgi:hypothetical protein